MKALRSYHYFLVHNPPRPTDMYHLINNEYLYDTVLVKTKKTLKKYLAHGNVPTSAFSIYMKNML